MTLEQYIKDYRQAVLHMTQEQAAEMCGVSSRTFQNWEAGVKVPRASNISALFYGDPTSEQEAQELRLEKINSETEIVEDNFEKETTEEVADKSVLADEKSDGFLDQIIRKIINSYRYSKARREHKSTKSFGNHRPLNGVLLPEDRVLTEKEVLDCEAKCIPFYNTAIFGETGSGKTLKLINWIKNIAQQSANNIIIADPNGEIKAHTENELKGAGYTVRTFDISKTNLGSLFGAVKHCIAGDSDLEKEIFKRDIWDIISQHYFEEDSDPFWARAAESIFVEIIDEYSSVSECLKYAEKYEFKREPNVSLSEKTKTTVLTLVTAVLTSLIPYNSEQSDLRDAYDNLCNDTRECLVNSTKYAYFLTGQRFPGNITGEVSLYCLLKMLDKVQIEITGEVTGETTRKSIPPVVLFVDEAANVLPKSYYTNFLALCSSKNIRCVMTFLNINQVKAKFGSKWDVVCGNSDVEIFLPNLNDAVTMEYAKNLCGKTTVIKSDSYGVQSIEAHDVVSISQIKAFEKGTELVITRGLGPHICSNDDFANLNTAE